MNENDLNKDNYGIFDKNFRISNNRRINYLKNEFKESF